MTNTDLTGDYQHLHPGMSHDDWMRELPHGDHHPSMDCLRCYAAGLWQVVEYAKTANALLSEVAHRAWHLLDDGGEMPDDDGLILASKRDADRLSDALDALEASGWSAHPEDESGRNEPSQDSLDDDSQIR